MTFGEAALLWFGGYLNVFLLGFQSRNANAGRYATCAVTSFLIAWCQAMFAKAAATGDFVTVSLLIGSSGSFGICSAIFVSQWLFERRKKTA